jgi:NAD(P)-dependent dehydrogenase (short-subunit alcohol dehydrogenase family)
MTQVRDKVAFITGGGSGVGLGQAKVFAQALASTEQCKTRLDAQLAIVAAEMRRGYREPRGNRLRDRRDQLTAIRFECNTNPRAWIQAGP